jgi:NitT/TauT family transport system permease protein
VVRNSRHLTHRSRHSSISYPISLIQRLYSFFVGPRLGVFLLFIVIKIFGAGATFGAGTVSVSDLIRALLATSGRLLIAYVLAILIGIALALLVTLNRKAEAIFLPLFDILESVPVLAFFPVLIIFFIKLNYLNGAAIFIIFLAMLWNIVFTVVGGLKIIPREFKEAATIFGVRGWSYFRKIILPAIFPELVTGSILAVAQGWNITIVAEVLHVYIPGGNPSQDLFGIGNILVRAASTAQTNLFIAALVAMVLMIAILNFFVWQKLLRYAERFKFE